MVFFVPIIDKTKKMKIENINMLLTMIEAAFEGLKPERGQAEVRS